MMNEIMKSNTTLKIQFLSGEMTTEKKRKEIDGIVTMKRKKKVIRCYKQ